MSTDKKTIAILIAVSVVLLGGIVLTARGRISPVQYGTPGGIPFGVSIRTLPASRHVTGTYPKQCTLSSANGQALPDKNCTPGSADAEVIAARLGNPGNLKGTICTPGWTRAAAAPSQELLSVLNAAQAAYNVRVPTGGAVLLDHLVPPDLGGSEDVSNLWPMPIEPGIQNLKANTDATVNKAVCAGTVGLAAAQQAMATNWTTALQQLGLT
jgi:hypothetical protein